MQHYDISVIIPVYNRISELSRTLQSLQAQTLDKSRFEVVIANNPAERAAALDKAKP
jgi:glycosyltransferase involved in cell wall biosynthesis